MTRTTISLPDALADLLKHEARSRGQSVSEVVRRSLSKTLGLEGRRQIPWAGICDDPEMSAAADLEQTLEESWLADLSGDR